MAGIARPSVFIATTAPHLDLPLMKRLTYALITLALLPCGEALAAVTPHPLFSEGAVLQRNKPVPIWGTADDGEKVTVAIQGQEAAGVAKDGMWLVNLKPLKAGGPFTLTITGDKSDRPVEIQNVLVGEVWVSSGQSNMEFNLGRSIGAEEAIAASGDAMLRLFTVPRKTSQTELTAINDDAFLLKAGRTVWKEAGPSSAPSFSAVAYYFGRDLRKALGVPVGLIHSSVGGTPAEAWTRRAALESEPGLKNVFEEDTRAMAAYPALLERHQAALEKHKAAVADAKE